MAVIPAQQAVAQYHSAIASHAHHGGHDMFTFHSTWHLQNQDPIPPFLQPNPDWGAEIAFGANFLQMHHEMVKATDAEPKVHMQHQSLVSWYESKGLELPAEWDPLSEIPDILGYSPDLDVFPPTLRNAILQLASQRGITPEDFLRRKTDSPNFALPKYFTREGIGPGDPAELYTGARKLADFQNINQLGCCIVFPHNKWHREIGGAMALLATAIADPIFYFGVHWHIDKVFDAYKQIQDEIVPHPVPPGSGGGTLPPVSFTTEQLRQREEDVALSRALKVEIPFSL